MLLNVSLYLFKNLVVNYVGVKKEIRNEKSLHGWEKNKIFSVTYSVSLDILSGQTPGFFPNF